MESSTTRTIRRSKRNKSQRRKWLPVLAASLPLVNGQQCIALAGSKACAAFNGSSISTNSGLVSTYPFLAFVSNTQQFDDRLNQYVSTSYVQQKYQQLLGCSNINLSNTNDLYARYTTSVVCNAIVQNSKAPCQVSDDDAPPLCADSCAQQAISEQMITSDSQTCSSPNNNAMDQIRADFTVCSLPAASLSRDCIDAAINEPDNCGFGPSMMGLCSYCAKSSPNATDSCCENSNLKGCQGVHLPPKTSLPPLVTTTTATPSPTAAAAASSSAAAAMGSQHGLSGGQIAGIVVGAVFGLALIAGLILFFCLYARRRGGSNKGSILNSPSPGRGGGPAMSKIPSSRAGHPQPEYEILPGGRIARMSALESHSEESMRKGGVSGPGVAAVGAAAGAAAARGRQQHDASSSDEFENSTDPHEHTGRSPLFPPPTSRRNGSLSSGSILAGGGDPTSPHSGSGDYSSPAVVASSQSEQLPSFKDYYSSEEIHPNDKVATLWAYQPRASDEFELERGDMLKVVGIWDDGWATGVRISERAEDWDVEHRAMRDSGVSNGSRPRDSGSPPITGEIKAFPLVCVCLPEHWRKTIDGDVGDGNRPPTP